MKADEAKRLASLENENSWLKKLVAELSLDKAILAEALDVAKNSEPDAATHDRAECVCRFDSSQRRAWDVTGYTRSTQRYVSVH